MKDLVEAGHGDIIYETISPKTAWFKAIVRDIILTVHYLICVYSDHSCLNEDHRTHDQTVIEFESLMNIL